MLTEKEKRYVEYWEKHRVEFSSFTSKISRGLPMAILFGLPILLFLISVYMFLPDWYAKLGIRHAGTLVAVVIGVMVIVLFFSFFRMHFLWEQNEQTFLELKEKQKKSDAANPAL